MKLICSKSNLLHGVNIVSKAVPTRTTMAILECILIDASANEIKLTANDMELGIETKIEGEIAERGVIALRFIPILTEELEKSHWMQKSFPRLSVNFQTVMLRSKLTHPLKQLLHVKKQNLTLSVNPVMIFPIFRTLNVTNQSLCPSSP